MGLAASQARLLSLTARIHDVEYQAQMIQSAKLALALQEDEVYRKYNEALDATTLTFQDMQGNRVKASFNNLCGIGSINNNIASNKNYIFRDSDGQLIVPSDVYEGYKEFGGDADPFQFAMFMMGVNTSDLNKIEEEFIKNNTDGTSNTNLQKTYDEQQNILSKIAEIRGCNVEDLNGGEGSPNIWAEADSELDETKKQELLDLGKTYNDLNKTFRYQLYRAGKEAMYKQIAGNDADFDKSKFDYYMKWGMLLQEEEVYLDGAGDLVGCTSAADYNNNIENDEVLFNQMIEAGKITIDTYSINNSTGKIDDNATSAASDSNLANTNVSQIDAKELKKAEAEYEHAMKKLNQKDKRFDMDLNRLETERSALTTEYDSVKKVIQENIERTFGIFS